MKKFFVAAAFAALGVCSTANADVFSYSATGTPGTLANGTAITDLSTAGNGGITENGINGNGLGEVSTVEDDPNGVAGDLSFNFDGSSARITTTGTDLLTDDVIAAAGGYSMSFWVKTAAGSNAGNHSLFTFAGTDGLNVSGGALAVIDRRGNIAFNGPSIDDDTWHRVLLSVDTTADVDGTANSTPGGPSGGVHGLEGVASLFVDGALVGGSTFNLAIGDFGDSLDRTVSVGGHPQGFGTTEFTGQIYNPSLVLGATAVPEPSSLLALGALAGVVVLRRRKNS